MPAHYHGNVAPCKAPSEVGLPRQRYARLRRLGLDVAPDARPPQQQQHIVLVNRAEVAAAPAPPAEA